MAAIFQHKVRREDCPTRRGIKYEMGSDVIYDAPEPVVMAR